MVCSHWVVTPSSNFRISADHYLKQFKTNNFPLTRVNKTGNLKRWSRQALLQKHNKHTFHVYHSAALRSKPLFAVTMHNIDKALPLKLFWTYHFYDLMKRDSKLHANSVCFLKHGMKLWVILFKQERQQPPFVIIC